MIVSAVSKRKHEVILKQWYSTLAAAEKLIIDFLHEKMFLEVGVYSEK